ncbi:MAG: N4-gp56 family major capsid protein [Nitrosomonadaceae bacterium]
MADTSAATGLTVQQWDERFFVDSLNASIFKPFMGSKSNSIINVKEDLVKKPGDSLTFSLVNALNNAAVTGSSTLEGNEESLVSRSQKVTIDQYRNAVRVPVLEEQFTAIPLREAGRDALLNWDMEHTRDKVITALGQINGVDYGSASEANKDAWLVDNTDRVLFGAVLSNHTTDHSAALLNIDNTADKLTPGAVSLLKRIAKTASPKIGPLKPRQGGVTSDSYVLFVPSLVLRDLTNDSDFLQANREARNRGKLNPIFAGADYIFDNIAIIEVEDIAVLAGVGAGGIDVAPVYLCGAGAVGLAWAKRPQSIDEEFDYGDKQGIAIRKWFEIAKLTFGTDGSSDTGDLKDHGIVTGFFASVADS